MTVHRSCQPQDPECDRADDQARGGDGGDRAARAAIGTSRAGRDYAPVTLRGVFNAAVTEARRLSVYIERGTEWLREIGRRAREPAARIAGLAEVAAQTLRQAAQERHAAEAARQERQARELARQAVKPEPTIVPKQSIKVPSIVALSKGRGFSR